MVTRQLAIKWCISKDARNDLANDIKSMGPELYKQMKYAVQDLLRGYFDAKLCDQYTTSIRPIAGAPDGLKAFKVRAPRPGSGRRGGYRVIAVVDCKDQRVAIQRVFLRVNNPSVEEVTAAAARGMSLTNPVPV
jgi:hypothetical protein